MESRRKFLGEVAGLAGSIAVPGKVLGAGLGLRVGFIGFGERGQQLAREVHNSKNVEIAAVADIYQRRREAALPLAPQARAFADYRELLDDRTIDAVFLATPQHLHAGPFADALDAGKHVYQERALALTIRQAKEMRAALEQHPRAVVQVGHQICSSGLYDDAAHFLRSERMGQIAGLRAHNYRNSPHERPPWVRPVYPDMTPESVAWNGFEGDGEAREFDADRFVNWRLYADYSGGNLHEGLAQQLAFWYRLLDLKIPTEATTVGGAFRWSDRHEVPDTLSVSLLQPEGFLVTWDSSFSNAHPGLGEMLLGEEGTIARAQQIRYVPERVNNREGVETLGRTATLPGAHVVNFLDAIRGRAAIRCPFETGFRVSVACSMAWESYRRRQTVRWDPEREEII